MIKIRKRSIALMSVAIVLAIVLIASNILASIFWKFLMTSFANENTDFGNETVKNALAVGDELVQEIGEDSIVLLKNDKNTLPLAESNRKVNLFGYGSTDNGFVHSGGGSGGTVLNGEAETGSDYEGYRVTLKKAFESEGFEYNKELDKIYTDYSNYNANLPRGIASIAQPSASVYTPQVIRNAKAFSQTAVIVISRNGSESTEIPLTQSKVSLPEDNKRTNLQLSIEEEDMIEIVSDNFSDVIVLLNTGNAFETGFIDDADIGAALYVGIMGQSGTLAIPRILKGYKTDKDGKKIAVSPSGKTADTYAYSTREYQPTNANMFPNPSTFGEIAYAEGIYVGYKWYETADKEKYFDEVSNDFGTGYEAVVQYPFGHGLSYTKFDWEVESVSLPSGSKLKADSKINIKVSVTNVGTTAGKDVVELYFTPEYHTNGIEKAYVNLLSFAKTVSLDPGKSQVVEFNITPYELASYDDYDKNRNGNAGYELDSGKYEIKLMTNAHTVAPCENSVITYNVPTTINIKKDPVTGNDIVNRFTGDTAFMNLPIDGNSVGSKINYLSRADFKGTFPSARTPDRENETFINSVNKAKNNRYDTDTLPTMNKNNRLQLVTKADGTKASLDELNGVKKVDLKYNDPLIKELVENYDSDKWDLLLNQMSADEMCSMAGDGFFGTRASSSIGKPKRKDIDGPSGFHGGTENTTVRGQWTAFPAEALVGCSWNPALAYNLGQAQGLIANATNVNGWYAPGLNLHRNAYSGRYFEYYSEDSVITGVLASEVIRGAKNRGLNCYMKHFAVSEEGINPDNVYTWLTEQMLREVYLKPFEIATKKGGANSVMTAFNCIGAVWAGACDPMNNDILRGEWGFKGSLISDWASGRPYMDIEQAIRGGNDLMLNSTKANTANKTSVNLSRTASKNIIYTWLETYWTAKDYQINGEKDNRYDVDLSIKIAEDPFSPLVVGLLVGLDVLLVAGIGTCVFFTFKPKKKSKKEE